MLHILPNQLSNRVITVVPIISVFKFIMVLVLILKSVIDFYRFKLRFPVSILYLVIIVL